MPLAMLVYSRCKMRFGIALTLVGMLPNLCLAQAEPDGPASKELREILQADQAARTVPKGFPIGGITFSVSKDTLRRRRVAELLKNDQVVTGEDYDNAAIIFQHGLTPDDYLVAHELYLVAQTKGKFGNGLAISEDRWLRSLNRPQRFGGQFGYDGQMQPVEEGLPYSVTDDLRMDFFIPPLEAARKKGPAATQDAFQAMFARLGERLDEAWIAKQSARPEALELKAMSLHEDAKAAEISRVVEMYCQGKILTGVDSLYAAQVLAHSSNAGELLLAHEFACIAAARKVPGGGRMFAFTLDKALVALGKSERYGAQKGQLAPSVCNGVLRVLNLGSR